MTDMLHRRSRHALVMVDPQNDFCDPAGSLFVPGADEDMKRLAQHIRENGREYTDVIISMDCHDKVAIFHPKYWVDEEGNHPSPFTLISRKDLDAGRWTPASRYNDAYTKRTFDLMERRSEFDIMIWPEHCIVSTWGALICAPIMKAIDEWRDMTGRSVRYVFKGESPYHEEFSIFDGPDGACLSDRATEDMVARLTLCETVDFAGEALSHCVLESIKSYVKLVGQKMIEKHTVTLLTDCTSPVSGFDRFECERRVAELGVVLNKAR